MKSNQKLHEKEFEFVSIIWEHEPITSGELAKLCEEKLHWKRTTTYTVLKKLSKKGILQNDNTIVTTLVQKEQIQCEESKRIMEKVFNNSLPDFLTAFMHQKTITKQEAEELKALIDAYEEGD